jgi:glycosyltransferase involved in cell wall biosynthesis
LANTIGAVSEGVKQDLAAVTGLPAKTITVLYNPVVGPELMRQADEPLKHDWFLDDAPPVVMAVGSLTPEKNFALLIGAFALLRARRRLRLMILGEGPLRDELAERAARTGYGDDIAMPGFVANPFNYMGRAAVVALSSDVEGLPTVLIEAMACGTPVVATDCPSGPAEILLDGKLGVLTTPGDVEAFAEALARTLDAPHSPEQLMKHAATFDVEQASSRYLDCFRLKGSVPPDAQDLAINGR